MRIDGHQHSWRYTPDCDTMTAKPAVDEIRLWRVQLLLALSVFINYLDRGNLSNAAPLLKNEFQLSATQLGVLLSSFFWTYSFFLPVSGWLVDRLDVKWVIASGFFLWSVATAATGAVHAFGTLLLVRLALGAGESVSYPACSTILSRFFPEHKRGFANASIVAGMALGPAFGTLAGGILMSRFGWRPIFLVVGLTSLLWLLPWLRWMPKGFILNHIAKPRARQGVVSPRRENLTELARRESVFCKLSGLVTEASWQSWTEADLDPYLQIALTAFGPERVIFGSDWPVILLGSSYKRCVDVVQRSISHLSEYEQERIFCETATEVYRL
jgi:MFS family permease